MTRQAGGLKNIPICGQLDKKINVNVSSLKIVGLSCGNLSRRNSPAICAKRRNHVFHEIYEHISRMHTANYLMTEERHKWKCTSRATVLLNNGNVNRATCVGLPRMRGKVPPHRHRDSRQKAAEGRS